MRLRWLTNDFSFLRQIRQGIANNSKGTAFVVYEDVHDSKMACDKLNGFNFQNRYLVGMLGKRRRYSEGIWKKKKKKKIGFNANGL